MPVCKFEPMTPRASPELAEIVRLSVRSDPLDQLMCLNLYQFTTKYLLPPVGQEGGCLETFLWARGHVDPKQQRIHPSAQAAFSPFGKARTT